MLTIAAKAVYCRFRACCERGYTAALQLVAWASKPDKGSLQTYYEQSCASGWFTAMQRAVPDFDDGVDSGDEAMDDEEELARNPCLDFDDRVNDTS